MATTTYMALILPVPSSTVGPTWATLLNAALTTLDSHTHVSGQGQQIPTAGLNINADLPFNSFNGTLLRSARFVNNSSTLALNTDAGCVFVAGGDLYYRSVAGQTVQITSGAAISASSLGGISGLAAPASAAFSSSGATFAWRSNTNVAATMDGGPLIIRDVAASALGITLASPTSLGAGYTITLPTAVPGATVLMQMSSGGVVSASNTITGTIANATSTPTAPSMLNSWVAGAGLGYWKDAVGMVHLKGTVRTPGSGGNQAFQLPAGFRPTSDRWYVCAEVSGLAALNFQILSSVTPGGVFALSTPASGTYDLSCIHFLGEA